MMREKTSGLVLSLWVGFKNEIKYKNVVFQNCSLLK